MVHELYILSDNFITNITWRVGKLRTPYGICSPYGQPCNFDDLSGIGEEVQISTVRVFTSSGLFFNLHDWSFINIFHKTIVFHLN